MFTLSDNDNGAVRGKCILQNSQLGPCDAANVAIFRKTSNNLWRLKNNNFCLYEDNDGQVGFSECNVSSHNYHWNVVTQGSMIVNMDTQHCLTPRKKSLATENCNRFLSSGFWLPKLVT